MNEAVKNEQGGVTRWKKSLYLSGRFSALLLLLHYGSINAETAGSSPTKRDSMGMTATPDGTIYLFGGSSHGGLRERVHKLPFSALSYAKALYAQVLGK